MLYLISDFEGLQLLDIFGPAVQNFFILLTVTSTHTHTHTHIYCMPTMTGVKVEVANPSLVTLVHHMVTELLKSTTNLNPLHLGQ